MPSNDHTFTGKLEFETGTEMGRNNDTMDKAFVWIYELVFSEDFKTVASGAMKFQDKDGNTPPRVSDAKLTPNTI